MRFDQPHVVIIKMADVLKKSIPRLDDGAKRYYNRVESFLDQDGEDKLLFSKNVMKQVCDSDGVARVCCDKDGSRALEHLLSKELVEEDSLRDFLGGVLTDYCAIATNRCGSHVIEVLLKSVAKTVTSTDTQSGELHEQFDSLCGLLKDHLQEFVVHPYASHVVSSLVQALSGVHLGDHVSRSRYSQEFRKAKMSKSKDKLRVSVHTVPASFSKRLEKIEKSLYKSDNFSDLLTHQCSSPVIQTLLRVLSHSQPKRASKLIKKMVKVSKVLNPSEDKHVSKSPVEEASRVSLPSVFTDPVGSHLIETVIEVATPELLQSVYESCFKGQLLTFALHPVANYPLQKLLGVAEPDQVSGFIDELSSLEEILFAGHTGVVVKLVEAAISCPDKQVILLQLMLKAFHTESKPKCCVPLFLALTAYEVYFDEEKKEGEAKDSQPKSIALHGSLFVQALLKFQDTKLVVLSLLKMTSCDIARVSCDSCGSHVITIFMTSPTVSSKSKLKLIDKLEAHLVQLSKDKHGSRVVDALWRNCEIGRKDQLAQELLTHEEELSSDFYGQIVLRNCNISHYKKKQDVWRDKERAAEKKRTLFQDIIGEEEVTLPKKKRKREHDNKDSLVMYHDYADVPK